MLQQVKSAKINIAKSPVQGTEESDVEGTNLKRFE